MSTPGTPPPGHHGYPPHGASGGYGPPQGPPQSPPPGGGYGPPPQGGQGGGYGPPQQGGGYGPPPQGPPGGGYGPPPHGGGYGPPPPGGYGPHGQPGYPGHGQPEKKNKKLPLIIGSVVALLLVIGAGAFFFVGDAEAGEVFLVPAASAGPDPFSETPFASAPDPAVAQPAAPASGAIRPTRSGPIQATSGAKPGLYGGSMNNASCDPRQMVSFLQQNPDKAQAWVNALNADSSVRLRDGQPLTVATIPQYVAGLTSIVLTSDTRVTNHGFKGNRANPLQAVLQKGSAVMVDNYGVPRVKCYCGNPLLPPKPTRGTPKYEGPRWPDFNPDEVTVITPPPQPIETFVVCDPRDLRACFEQPTGGVPNQPYVGELTPVPPQVAVSNNPPTDDGYDPVPPELWGDEGENPPDAEPQYDPVPDYMYDHDEGDGDNGYSDQEMADIMAQEEGANSYEPEEAFSADDYAQTAIIQYEEMQRRGCGFSGSLWHGGYDSHRSWASTKSVDQRLAEMNKRQDMLRQQCQP